MATEETVVENVAETKVEVKEKAENITEAKNGEPDGKQDEVQSGEQEGKQDEVQNGEQEGKNGDVKESESQKIQHQEGDANAKDEDKTEAEREALEKKIVRQIEYYFGDINLPKDRFLQEQIKLDDGWIPMTTMLKFKRLASLSMDEKLIMDVLKKSSELIETNEEEKKIRRDPARALPEWNDERKAELNDRTVYVKGFPTDGMNLDIFLEFFKPYGKIDNIFLNMLNDKLENRSTFKGSVYVLFNDKEEAQKFLELESVKYKDVELEKTWSKDHNQEKKRKIKEAKDEMRNKFARKPVGEEDDAMDSKKDVVPAFSKLGTIVHLTGFSRDTTREDISEKLEPYEIEIAYVDFLKGNEEAWIRLEEENAGKELEEKIKAEKNFEICGADITCRVLEGEEEKTYLEKAKEDKEKRWQKNQRTKSFNRRGRGRGGRGFKRSNRDDDSARPKRQRRTQ